MNIMEEKIKTLYKVYVRGGNHVFVAADSQQEAVEKAAEAFATESPTRFSIEYIGEVYV